METVDIELVRKKLGKEVYGMVMPLVTDSTGKKFGKTEGNALWLDKNKTSSYELYQYLINLEDCMIIDYLKKLTFLSKEEIEEIEKSHNENPHLREAHKALAREIITDLHGEEEYNKWLEKMNEEEREKCIFPVEYIFRGLDEVVLPDFFSRLAHSGLEIYLKKINLDLSLGTRVRLLDKDGFFAVGEVREFEDGAAIKPIRQF